MTFKKLPHIQKGTRKILLITVELADNVSFGPLQSPIDRVVHARILFDASQYSTVMREPVERPIVRFAVLDDMFELHPLISNGGDAEL